MVVSEVRSEPQSSEIRAGTIKSSYAVCVLQKRQPIYNRPTISEIPQSIVRQYTDRAILTKPKNAAEPRLGSVYFAVVRQLWISLVTRLTVPLILYAKQ